MTTQEQTIHFNEQEVQNLKKSQQSGNVGHGENPIESISWAGGGFFILLGAIFLLTRNELPFLGGSQWLVWMLIPLYWIVVGGYHAYLRNGRKIAPAFLIWTLFPFLFIALGFIIGWNVAWPFVLIAIGLATILGRSFS